MKNGNKISPEQRDLIDHLEHHLEKHLQSSNSEMLIGASVSASMKTNTGISETQRLFCVVFHTINPKAVAALIDLVIDTHQCHVH